MSDRQAATEHLLNIATGNTREQRDAAVTQLLRLTDNEITAAQVSKATRTPGPVEKLTGLYDSERKSR